MGRTGKWTAYQHFGITPDVTTLAKPLAGGIPIGAMLCTEAAARAIKPGMHGTTFGGNPLACAVAIAVVDTLRNENFLDHNTRGRQLLPHATPRSSAQAPRHPRSPRPRPHDRRRPRISRPRQGHPHRHDAAPHPAQSHPRHRAALPAAIPHHNRSTSTRPSPRSTIC